MTAPFANWQNGGAAPTDALAHDVGQVGDAAGAALAPATLLAHGLVRLAALPPAARAGVGRALARTLHEAAPVAELDAFGDLADAEGALAQLVRAHPTGGLPLVPARARIAGAWLAALLETPDEPGRRAGVAEGTVAAVQALAADLERAEAFALAATLLAALRRALALAPAMMAAVLTQEGRVARQQGDLGRAADFYGLAAARARRAADVAGEARARIGQGVVANMRGNFPEARRRFARARRLARAAGHAEYVHAAERGLLHAALTAGAVDLALTIGWRSLRRATTDEERAEALTNLGEGSRLGGHWAAALRAYLRAIELSSTPRIYLAALGGAALAAAALDDRRLALLLADRVGAAAARGGQPYHAAVALLETGEALAGAGEADRAGELLARSQALAAQHGFHEVSFRADAALAALGDGSRAAPRGAVPPDAVPDDAVPDDLAPHDGPRAAARAVLRRLERLPVALGAPQG